MEIFCEGLVLVEGTVLAKMARDTRGTPVLSLGDEQRMMALLATAFERPVSACVLAKIERAAALWNEGKKCLPIFISRLSAAIRGGGPVSSTVCR